MGVQVGGEAVGDEVGDDVAVAAHPGAIMVKRRQQIYTIYYFHARLPR